MTDTGRFRGGLGRGLDALIPKSGPGVTEVGVEQIGANPLQPRRRFDPESLRELADSIREHGVLQPLVVSRSRDEEGERYQLVVGERRLQAARLAGLAKVPVVVREVTPVQSLELALVENIQRADLTPLEEASAYRQLMSEFGLTQEQVAQRVGKSRPTVTNSLRLLSLPDDVKASLDRGEISEGHARALLGLGGEEEQRSALGEIVDGKLSVRATEDLVRRHQAERERGEADRSAQAEIRAIEDEFRVALGTRVKLVRRGDGGQLTIYFYTEEQLQSLYDALVQK